MEGFKNNLPMERSGGKEERMIVSKEINKKHNTEPDNKQLGITL